jgi:hypothetical protein
MTLKWHGAVYLAASAATSGLAGMAARHFLFTSRSVGIVAPDLQAWLAAATALLAVAMVLRGGALEKRPWNHRFLTVVVTANAAWGILGILAAALSVAGSRFPALADWHPTMLTALLTGVTASLALAATHFQKSELVWPAYLFMAMATYKLIVQDLRQAQTIAIVLSLLMYGGLLVLVPRLLQRPGKAARQTAGAS